MKIIGKDPIAPIKDAGIIVKDGGRDFDFAHGVNADLSVNFPGLTKREYFAALAMQGLCVNKSHSDIINGQCVDIAQEAVVIADALIEELNKKTVDPEKI